MSSGSFYIQSYVSININNEKTLPKGRKIIFRKRLKGTQAGRVDKYYHSPDGYMCRSLLEVQRYIKEQEKEKKSTVDSVRIRTDVEHKLSRYKDDCWLVILVMSKNDTRDKVKLTL